MRIEILRDVTVTVKAGQVVEVKDDEATTAIRLGFAAPEKKKPVKKK